MPHENQTTQTVQSPDSKGTCASKPAAVLNQQADLSAIMHFNADRRFSITE
ncbi:MAG: hypothetical protein V4581_15710 [Bacteroidota bacterium]